jgi:hypothetical protein
MYCLPIKIDLPSRDSSGKKRLEEFQYEVD